MSEDVQDDLYFQTVTRTGPPRAFNLRDEVFRPDAPFRMDTALFEEIRQLIHETRFRTAMNRLLEVLEAKPNDPFALRLVMLTKDSRTEMLQAAEPLTEGQLLDQRLDGLFITCSHCGIKSWMPMATLFLGFGQFRVQDPVGTQCYNCGYVVCRDCMQTEFVTGEMDLISTVCPNCNEEALKYPVYPTGRRPQQMERHAEPVTHVIVFREGPIPPDQAYIESALEVASPDALKGGVSLHPVPLWPWPDEDERNLIYAYVTRYLMERNIRTPLSEVEFAKVKRDHLGNRGYIAKVMAPRQLARQVRERITRHLERAEEVFAGDPQLAATRAEWELLLDQEILRYLQIDVAKNIEVSAQEGRHVYLTRQSPQLTWIVSLIPALSAHLVRLYFEQPYLDFLLGHLASNDLDHLLGNSNIAHLVFCHEGDKLALHMAFLPRSPDMVTMMAQDLLSKEERAGLSLETDQGDVASTAPGALFWFDWQAISALGRPNYGRYAYGKLLGALAGILREHPVHELVFFDGDFLPQGPIDIPLQGPEERSLLEQIVGRGPENCYVIAVYGEGRLLESLHHELAAAKPTGYLGKTSFAKEFRDFYDFTGEMALVFAARLRDMRFEQAGGTILSEGQLRDWGFESASFTS